MEWQPIETAPNDGEPVLVFGGRYLMAAMASADGDWWRYCADTGYSSVPTHWMPLPPPPRQRDTGQ